MNVTIQIPDDVARHLASTGIDLSRRALEALAIDEYKNGHLTMSAMRQLLGFETRDQLDEFLKSHVDREQKDRISSLSSEPTSITDLQKTNPQEWARRFHEWAESHDRTTPLLSDDAVSRESIYSD